MDRIAVIADIHGNLPALRAVLADIEARGITRIHCLGDLAGKGPDGAQAVDLCRERCEAIVRGNWDEALGKPGQSRSMVWYRQELGPERCAFLGGLPFSHDFLMSGQRVRLVHASPQGVYHRVFQAGPIEPMLAMFDATDLTDPRLVPDVVGCADIHTPYMRSFRRRLLFNVGSVGNPLDQPLASYAILEGVLDGTAESPFSINLVRLPYDIEQAIEDARRAEAPDLAAYECELRTAPYRGSMPDPTPAAG